jgi:hypothetical protein
VYAVISNGRDARDVPDGSEQMLKTLNGDPPAYKEFARDYYEVEIPLDAVEHIYANLPFTKGVVQSLNVSLNMRILKQI